MIVMTMSGSYELTEKNNVYMKNCKVSIEPIEDRDTKTDNKVVHV